MIGDFADMLKRLRHNLPEGWFSDDAPVVDAVVTAPATSFKLAYDLIAFADLQTRIATATGGFLDLISYDYFGTGLPRYPGESDAAFRARILRRLFADRVTRKSMVDALTELTGIAPIAHEPRRPIDNTVYNGRGGYSVGTTYGSIFHPYQAWIEVFRPVGVTDEMIYEVIRFTRPGATKIWVRITPLIPQPVQANYLTQQDLSNLYWTKENVTPLGTDTLVETAAVGNHGLFKNNLPRAAGVKTFVLFVDIEYGSQHPYLYFQVFDGSYGTLVQATFNLAGRAVEYLAVAFGVFTAPAASVIPVPGSNKLRARLEFTTDASTTDFNISIRPAIGSGGPSYPGSISRSATITNLWVFNKNAGPGGS